MTDRRDHEPFLPTGALRTALVIAVAVLLAAIAVDIAYPPKGKFGLDGIVGFKAWYGAFGTVAIIAAVRFLRSFLERPDDHYGD